MDIHKRLLEIWSNDYIATLPALVKDRGFDFSENSEQKDILIIGFNPSFNPTETKNKHFNFSEIINAEKLPTQYWQPFKKMLFDNESNIDLRNIVAYSDLFYFREQNQAVWSKEVLPSNGGIQFAVEQINLTQHIVEYIIKPKLIVVKNKEAWAYWGKLFESEKVVWMGYGFDFVQNMDCGELWKISGLLDSNERIAPEIKETNLKNSYILFSKFSRFEKLEERPTPAILKTILDCYDAEKKVRNLAR